MYADDVEGAEGSGAVDERVDNFFAGKRDDPRREEVDGFDEFWRYAKFIEVARASVGLPKKNPSDGEARRRKGRTASSAASTTPARTLQTERA